MLYLTITFSDNTQNGYIAEQMRITKGYVKIENSTYGNRAFPKTDIISVRVTIVEDEE